MGVWLVSVLDGWTMENGRIYWKRHRWMVSAKNASIAEKIVLNRHRNGADLECVLMMDGTDVCGECKFRMRTRKECGNTVGKDGVLCYRKLELEMRRV